MSKYDKLARKSHHKFLKTKNYKTSTMNHYQNHIFDSNQSTSLLSIQKVYGKISNPILQKHIIMDEHCKATSPV